MSLSSILAGASPTLVDVLKTLDAQRQGNRVGASVGATVSPPSPGQALGSTIGGVVSPKASPYRPVSIPEPAPQVAVAPTYGIAPSAPETEPPPVQAPAPSVSPVQTLVPSLRDQAAGLYQQAQAIPGVQNPHLALGAADGIALLASLLAGRSGGQLASGYLQGREQGANQVAQVQGQNNELQRQALLSQAQGLTKAADTQDLIQGRGDVAKTNADSRRDVAQIRGAFSYDNAKLKASTTLKTADLASQDKEFAQLLKQSRSDVPEERVLALQSLRENYPRLFGGASDDQIAAAGEATDKELLQRAQATQSRAKAAQDLADAGYSSFRTARGKALLQTDIDGAKAIIALHQSEANKANAGVTETLSKSHLDEAQAQKIRTETQYIDPDFRQKWAMSRARIAEINQKVLDAQNGNGDGPTGQDAKDLRQAYQTQANIAKQQIDRITQKGKGKPPEPLLNGEDNPDYTPYIQAVRAQQDALKGIQTLMPKRQSQTVNAVTSGRVPSNPNAGGSTVLAGGAYGGNQATAQGVSQPSVGKLFGQTFRANESDLYQQAQQAVQQYRSNPKALAAIQREVIAQLQKRRAGQ